MNTINDINRINTMRKISSMNNTNVMSNTNAMNNTNVMSNQSSNSISKRTAYTLFGIGFVIQIVYMIIVYIYIYKFDNYNTVEYNNLFLSDENEGYTELTSSSDVLHIEKSSNYKVNSKNNVEGYYVVIYSYSPIDNIKWDVKDNSNISYLTGTNKTASKRINGKNFYKLVINFNIFNKSLNTNLVYTKPTDTKIFIESINIYYSKKVSSSYI